MASYESLAAWEAAQGGGDPATVLDLSHVVAEQWLAGTAEPGTDMAAVLLGTITTFDQP